MYIHVLFLFSLSEGYIFSVLGRLTLHSAGCIVPGQTNVFVHMTIEVQSHYSSLCENA